MRLAAWSALFFIGAIPVQFLLKGAMSLFEGLDSEKHQLLATTAQPLLLTAGVYGSVLKWVVDRLVAAPEEER